MEHPLLAYYGTPKELRLSLILLVRATLKHCGDHTITWADRGENQSMDKSMRHTIRRISPDRGEYQREESKVPIASLYYTMLDCNQGHHSVPTNPALLLHSDYQRLTTELLSPAAVMSEGLGFNLCVVLFLNVCVLNLPQRVRGRGCWRWLELGWRWLEVSY